MIKLKSTLAQRLFFGCLMILLLVGVFICDGYFSSRQALSASGKCQGIIFTLIVAVVASLGARELFGMVAAKKTNASLSVTIVSIVSIVTSALWFHGDLLYLLSTLLLASSLYHGLKYGTEETFAAIGQCCFVVIYLGVGCYFFTKIRGLGHDQTTIWGQISIVVMFMTVVKCADIGAFFTGMAIGKHKWVPKISPGKTWEGFIGGAILSTIVAFLFTYCIDIMVYKAVVYGVVLGVAGPLGDLFESMLKRDAGSKDSAKMVPAFGGMMDLLDSLVIAAPVAYCILTCWIY
jgi:phosphatidate cytidylyltransferase